MSWAQRRKATYIFYIFFTILLILVAIVFLFFYKTPTCFDNKQNQGEQGIDCGGPCSILCRAQYVDPVIVWGPRWEKVLSGGIYNFLTYIQNPNTGIGALNVPYIMKVYDRENVLLIQKTNITNIPPNNNFVIFEDNINLGDKIPARATFEFTGNPTWQKMQSVESNITAISKNLINIDTKPKLLVTMKNSTIEPIQNIEVVSILYNENGNAVAFSKTKIDTISGESTADIVFTWPEAFMEKIVRIDIVSKVAPK